MQSTQQQQLRNRILIRDRDSTNQQARHIGGQRVSFVYKREFAHEPRQYAVPLPSSSPSHAVFDERGCTYREDHNPTDKSHIRSHVRSHVRSHAKMSSDLFCQSLSYFAIKIKVKLIDEHYFCVSNYFVSHRRSVGFGSRYRNSTNAWSRCSRWSIESRWCAPQVFVSRCHNRLNTGSRYSRWPIMESRQCAPQVLVSKCWNRSRWSRCPRWPMMESRQCAPQLLVSRCQNRLNEGSRYSRWPMMESRRCASQVFVSRCRNSSNAWSSFPRWSIPY